MHSIDRTVSVFSVIQIWIECNRCSPLCRVFRVNLAFVSKRKGLGFGLCPNCDWHRRWICIRPIAWNWTNSMCRAPTQPIVHRSRVAPQADYSAIYWMCLAFRTDTIVKLGLQNLEHRKYSFLFDLQFFIRQNDRNGSHLRYALWVADVLFARRTN